MAARAKSTWQNNMRSVHVSILRQGASGGTSWSVTYKEANVGDEKAREVVLAEGRWDALLETREQAVRALATVMTEVWAIHGPKE